MNSEETDLRQQDGEDTSYDHVLKYTGVFGGVQVLTMLVSMLRNKLAAWWLNKAGMGFFLMYSNIASFVSSASNAGIPFSAVKNVSELYETADSAQLESYVVTVRSWSLWTALFGALLCVLMAPPISYFAFDGDWSYTLEVALLAPMIFAIAITNGEISILKGTRKLKRVAIISAASALLTLLSVLPFFYLWGVHGVIPALVINALVVMVVHLRFSLPVFPWHVSLFSRRVLQQGMDMIKLGIPYVAASIINAFTALAIPAFLLGIGNIDDVGLYKVGYSIMVVYAGIVFVAVETDYFPRLSAVNNNVGRMNYAINQQIDICVLLMAPLLVFMMMAMPWIVRLLYTAEFLPVVSMAVYSAFYMFFRAIMLPIAYTSLAKGDTLTYLVMEVVYDAFSFALIAAGFYWGGITGTGIALSVAGLLDVLMIATCYSLRYGFRFFSSTVKLVAVQGCLLLAAMAFCILGNVWLKYVGCMVVMLLSAFYSFRLLQKKTTVIDALKRKFINR